MATNQFPAALNIKEEDLQKLLACNVHIGSKNLEPGMARYIWKRRNDGVFLINLLKTWEKLVLAARIIVAIENPADVCVISARPYGQRAVLKFAKYTGAQAIAGRFTPGTFTNQIQEKFVEPRLLILSDPRADHQAIRESSYVNIPTIAFCHTDSPLQNIDVAVPCNNKAVNSIGLMFWLLCREVLYLRNNKGVTREVPWDVMPDLFFYRNPEEDNKEESAILVPEDVAQPRVVDGVESVEWGPTDGNWEKPGQEWTSTTGEWGAQEAAPSWDVATGPQDATWQTES